MIEIRGLDEFAKTLRTIDPRLNKQLQKAHKEVATLVAGKASTRVAGLNSPRSTLAAGGIRPRASQKDAAVVLLASNKFVRAAVFGTQVHWVFGRAVPAGSMMRRVWQPWIGNDWTAEHGLYGVSPAIHEAIPTVVETYQQRIWEALSVAFPD